MNLIIIFDALKVKIRDADSRMVKNKASHIALGVTWDGEHGGLILLTHSRHLNAVVDGLKDFPEAIIAAFPNTTVQTYTVYPIQHLMNLLRLEGPQGRGRRFAPDLPGSDGR